VLGALAGALVAAVLLLGAGVLWWSGATLSTDSQALAHVGLQPLAGEVTAARVTDARGNRVPTSLTHGALVPRARLASGQKLSVVVTVRRPGWLGWAIGRTTTERLSVVTPEPALRQRWLTVGASGRLALHFSGPVQRVAYREEAGAHGVVESNGSTVMLDRGAASSGTVRVRVAARTWERLGSPVTVTWFPPSQLPVARVSPAPGATVSPRAPLRLTFSVPLAQVFGGRLPKAPAAGHWTRADSHTLVFAPSGFGLPFASELSIALGTQVEISSGVSSLVRAKTVSWRVAGASFLRLQQLLAQAGYLPLVWNAAGADVPRAAGAEVDAAIEAPPGRFLWRYPNTPPELTRLWIAGQPNEITRGAVMMFQHDRGLTVDGIAGAEVWQSLLRYALSGQRRSAGYSYVYVHRNVPQLLTLWHNGTTVLTSPGNTGVPAAPTQLGTFPVFEHIPVGRMSGRNPDGSHYDDPGIRWISYFHGGEALHAFTRASFGTPQSLGCVELPLETAARVWPYTPIGTLVTIED
jgi:peptidoglycan hydrolase-like protein with peptidoglycan-binding domain